MFSSLILKKNADFCHLSLTSLFDFLLKILSAYVETTVISVELMTFLRTGSSCCQEIH